ncbi:MAG: VOC family protein [Acidimicrobiales bacterium]|jgi:predicted enzyme related to lactoylglutathione lyase|nr:VOC family protein [Acidimicrobiales bacterium]
MASSVPQLASVVVNVVDLEREKAFWSALLDVAVAQELPGFVWLAPQHVGGISLALQQVEDPKPGRNRVHLDTGVADLDGAQARIEALGGSHVESHEIAGFRWRVMADPEGNEFCIAVHP